MSHILQDLYLACDPNAPATEEQYFDTTEVRGGYAFESEILRSLAFNSNDDGMAESFVCATFTGHIGGGKSSELRHLEAALQTGSEGQRWRQLPVFVDALEYLDEWDTDTEDILLAVLAELAEQVRLKTNIDLKETYLSKRWDEIKTSFLSHVGVKDAQVPIGDVKVTVQLLKQSRGARKKLREALRPKLPTFLQALNTALDDIRDRLRKAVPKDGGAHYAGFVLIADGLDRILRVEGRSEGEESQRLLFVERGWQLRSLRSHSIWTVPLALVRAAPGELAAAFGREAFVLPMVKTEYRGPNHDRYPAGHKCLSDVLSRRANPHPLDAAISPDAREWMLDQCGGDIRHLLAFVQAACELTDRPFIDLRAARRAVGQTAATFGPAIRLAYWPKMAELEMSASQEIDNNDSDYRDMLRQAWVLEYMNGERGADADTETPWYGVHPVVRRLPQFIRAVTTLAEERARQATPDPVEDADG